MPKIFLTIGIINIKGQEELRAVTSAVVPLVGDEWQDKISETLTSFEGQLIRHPLTNEVMAQLAKKI